MRNKLGLKFKHPLLCLVVTYSILAIIPVTSAQSAHTAGNSDRWNSIKRQLGTFHDESFLSALVAPLRDDNTRRTDSLAVTKRSLPEVVPNGMAGVARVLAYEDDSTLSQKLLDHIDTTLKIAADPRSPFGRLSELSSFLHTGNSYLPYPFYFVSEAKARSIAVNLVEAARTFTRKHSEVNPQKLYPLVISSLGAIIWDFIPIQTEYAARLAVQSWFNNVRSDVNNYKFACNMVNVKHSDVQFQRNDVIRGEVPVPKKTEQKDRNVSKGRASVVQKPVLVDNYILALLRFIRTVSACRSAETFFSDGRVFPAFISTINLGGFRDLERLIGTTHPRPPAPLDPVEQPVLRPIENPPGEKIKQVNTPKKEEPDVTPPKIIEKEKPRTTPDSDLDRAGATKQVRRDDPPDNPPNPPPKSPENTKKKDVPHTPTDLGPQVEKKTLPHKPPSPPHTDPVIPPPLKKEEPVEEKKPPVEENKTPVEEKKQPAEENKTPVEEKKPPVDEKKRPAEEKKPPVEDDPHIMQEALRRQARLAMSLIDLYYKLMSVGSLVADAGTRIILKSALGDMVALIVSQDQSLKRARKDTDQMILLTLSAIGLMSHEK